jgi:hypothetical protein
MNIEIAPTELYVNWDDAKLYCFSLNIDGKTGWRLPTLAELTKIHQLGGYESNYWYWSSDSDKDTGVWVKRMFFGQDEVRNKESAYGRVIAVRDL